MRKLSMGMVPVGRGGADLVEASKRGELPQQMDESDAQYALFLAFCQAEPSQTLEDIAKQIGTTKGWLSRLRKQCHWDERIIDWRLGRKGPGEVAEVGDWVERREELRRREWDAQMRAVELCNRMFEKWRCAKELPSLGEVTKLLELASKLGRMASGMPLSPPEAMAEKPTFRIDIEAALARAYGREKPAVATLEAPPCPAEAENSAGDGENAPGPQMANDC